jgi:hypothetical protein
VLLGLCGSKSELGYGREKVGRWLRKQASGPKREYLFSFSFSFISKPISKHFESI